MLDKDTELTFIEHLEEVRKRLLIIFFAFAIFFSLGFYFSEVLLHWMKFPGRLYLDTLSVFSPTSAILTLFKIALFFGLIFSLPILFYEIWMFIRPALDESLLWSGAFLIIFGTGLFIMGVLLSFYFLIPASLKFLLNIGRGNLQFLISLDAYISFVLFFMLAGGLVFEIPLFAFFLAKFKIITVQTMINYWKIAVVGSVVLSALITPTPDAFNMTLIAIPIFILYTFSIGIVMLTQRKNNRYN